MNITQAKELLLFHSFSNPNFDPSEMERGFLGSLRPYTGLKKENFDEVISALKTLAPQLQSENFVDKEIISSLWGICFYGKLWGVDEDSMLVRNKLITPEDKEVLKEWIDNISFTVSSLLEGNDINSSFNC